MKKLFLFLLLIPTLIFGQSFDTSRVQYFPAVDKNFNKIRDFAVAVIPPKNYDPAKQYKWRIAIHGIGERSAGALANLQNLVLGFDYNNDGVREGPPLVTTDMKLAIDLFDEFLFVPTYDGFMEPDKINKIYDFARANYTVLPKITQLDGFSYGGGAVVKYITSSLTNANRVAYAVPCAPTRNIVDASIPGKANLPVHIFVNDNDNNGPTNMDVAKGIISSLNAGNPALKAIYTAFRKDGHGSYPEAMTIAPPKAPGGQGFTDAAESTYQVSADIVINGARQMRSGGVIPPPPIDTTPLITAKAVVTFKLTGSKLLLDGTQSIGWNNNGSNGAWEYAGGPVQYSWDVFPNGSTYIFADALLTKPGTYNFRFRLKGDPEVQAISVAFGKVPVAFDSETDLITYSDGSTEKGTAVFSAGKWAVKTAAGQVIQL